MSEQPARSDIYLVQQTLHADDLRHTKGKFSLSQLAIIFNPIRNQFRQILLAIPLPKGYVMRLTVCRGQMLCLLWPLALFIRTRTIFFICLYSNLALT
jgi:hypothetical protein